MVPMRLSHTIAPVTLHLTAWRTYLEVCRRGSLSTAAASLGYTQSAVSRQIAALEAEVGAPLLERRPRGVATTPAGDAFRRHARVVVNEAARAVRAAREASAEAGPLLIGATPSTASGLVPAALQRFRSEGGAPDWTLLSALTPELEAMVETGELDLAIVTDAPPGLAPDPRLERRLILVDEMRVLVPPDHPAASAEGPVPLGRFAEESWAEDDDGSAALLRSAALRAGFEPRIDVRAADLPGKTAMVAAGHCVALVPGVLRPALRPDVVPVRIADPPTRGVYATLPASGPRSAAVERLLEALAP